METKKDKNPTKEIIQYFVWLIAFLTFVLSLLRAIDTGDKWAKLFTCIFAILFLVIVTYSIVPPYGIAWSRRKFSFALGVLILCVLLNLFLPIRTFCCARYIQSPTPTNTDTPTITPTYTNTATPTETGTPTPTLTATPDIPSLLINKIDDYYHCVNEKSSVALEECWNKLSDMPGEYHESLNMGYGGLPGFITRWSEMGANYRLYYCYDDSVVAGYYTYKKSDLPHQITGTVTWYHIRYIFALDAGNNWRIAHGFITLIDINNWRALHGYSAISYINSECEENPRVENIR